MLVCTLGHVSLSNGLFIELMKVSFKVDVLLSAVQLSKSLFEKIVADFIVLGLRDSNSLSGLVITESSGLGNDRDVSGWVDLLEHHLELVEQP